VLGSGRAATVLHGAPRALNRPGATQLTPPLGGLYAFPDDPQNTVGPPLCDPRHADMHVEVVRCKTLPKPCVRRRSQEHRWSTTLCVTPKCTSGRPDHRDFLADDPSGAAVRPTVSGAHFSREKVWSNR
jgi:hypothetical protein